MSDPNRPHVLAECPDVSRELLRRVAADYGRDAPVGSLTDHIEDSYGLDLSTEYAGYCIRNPWGKASGQLSMTAHQVAEDIDAELGFVVLKTVIAQDESGTQMMRDWAIKESRMLAEPISGQSGETGWTISWKGRGWWLSFSEYLELIRQSRRLARDSRTLIVPSCKYHLPTAAESSWNIDEYVFTTRELLKAWHSEDFADDGPMPLEKDFSPTLAGSDRASAETQILEWLTTVPRLIREATPANDSIRLGLKVFNTLFDDDFQLAMLKTIHEADENRPAFHVYGNRLFDPNREFEGHHGIAYGGPDLSDRNLRVMTQFQTDHRDGKIGGQLIPWSATGNIVTGKMALEYALRGAASFQLHTFFQLPSRQYSLKTGSKIQKALHELYFHPSTGLIVWMHHLARQLDLDSSPIRFGDIVGMSELNN